MMFPDSGIYHDLGGPHMECHDLLWAPHSKRDRLAVCLQRRPRVEEEGTWRLTLRGNGEWS